MSRMPLFNSPLLLGFEHFERALDRVNKIAGDGYPPYNVEQLGENELRITLAVAGFTMADLSITVEDNQLVIRGKQTDDAQRIYLHPHLIGQMNLVDLGFLHRSFEPVITPAFDGEQRRTRHCHITDIRLPGHNHPADRGRNSGEA